jgi:hypothetical protein
MSDPEHDSQILAFAGGQKERERGGGDERNKFSLSVHKQKRRLGHLSRRFGSANV